MDRKEAGRVRVDRKTCNSAVYKNLNRTVCASCRGILQEVKRMTYVETTSVCPSVSNLLSATKPFAWFLRNSVRQLFTKICAVNASFMKSGTVTDVLCLRECMNCYQYFPNFVHQFPLNAVQNISTQCCWTGHKTQERSEQFDVEPAGT